MSGTGVEVAPRPSLAERMAPSIETARVAQAR